MPVGSVHIQTAGTVLTLFYHDVIWKCSFIKANCRKKKTQNLLLTPTSFYLLNNNRCVDLGAKNPKTATRFW